MTHEIFFRCTINHLKSKYERNKNKSQQKGVNHSVLSLSLTRITPAGEQLGKSFEQTSPQQTTLLGLRPY